MRWHRKSFTVCSRWSGKAFGYNKNFYYLIYYHSFQSQYTCDRIASQYQCENHIYRLEYSACVQFSFPPFLLPVYSQISRRHHQRKKEKEFTDTQKESLPWILWCWIRVRDSMSLLNIYQDSLLFSPKSYLTLWNPKAQHTIGATVLGTATLS